MGNSILLSRVDINSLKKSPYNPHKSLPHIHIHTFIQLYPHTRMSIFLLVLYNFLPLHSVAHTLQISTAHFPKSHHGVLYNFPFRSARFRFSSPDFPKSHHGVSVAYNFPLPKPRPDFRKSRHGTSPTCIQLRFTQIF